MSIKKLCYQDEDLSDDGCDAVKEDLLLDSQIAHLYLNVSQNNIGQEGAELIAEGLECFQNLKSLFFDISHNSIGKLGASQIAKSLNGSTTISDLTLQFQGQNYIGDTGLEALSDFIINQECLLQVKIDLSYSNYITDLGIKSLMASLGKHSNCLSQLSLYLRNNSIVDEGVTLIGDQLAQFKQLKYLSLSIKDNGIKNQGYLRLIEGLTNIKDQLQSLHLSATFTRPSFQQLCQALETFSLKKISIDFRMCCYNDTQLQQLSQSFSKLSNSLERIQLNLSENEFEDEGVINLIRNVYYVSELDLKINQNKLTNDGIVKMLKLITTTCKQLQILKFEAITEQLNILDNYDKRKLFLSHLAEMSYISLVLPKVLWVEYFPEKERLFQNMFFKIKKLVVFEASKFNQQ